MEINHQLQWASFMRSSALSQINISPNVSITGQALSDVTLSCISDKHGDYQVSFKLVDQCADIACFLSQVTSESTITVQLTKLGQQSDEATLKTVFNQFINIIKPRIKEAKKEQDIQSIIFVGNTFVLNNTTTFDVLTDDGEGRLTINIHGDNKQDNLNLSSHGLLDGLYLGIIKEATSH
jgi:hypothetical protein